MRAHLQWLTVLVLGAVPRTLGQTTDPLSAFVSDAFSVYTEVRSMLSVQATAAASTTTSTSSSISSSTSSLPSSTSSSTFTTSATSTRVRTAIQSPSNTAEAAAASSSAAAAVAAAHAQNNKNRTTAIALGVVLGLLAIALLVGLLLFCLRRRRRKRAVGSRRSLSPDSVNGATWGKETHKSTHAAGTTTPGRFSTSERRHAPVAAAAPLMNENALKHDQHPALRGGAPIPHRGEPSFQPGLMDGAAAGHAPHHRSPNHIPLSSHSRSSAAAAGLGGAALGALAAKHHHDKHDKRDFAHPHEHHQGIARKPVGGALGNGAVGQSPNSGVVNNPVADTNSGPAFGHGNPPAYNGNAPALSSHPPFEPSHRRSSGHEPLMAGAAGFGAGALGGAAATRHHDGNRDSESSLTGRRSWDPNRQPQRPQSILANAAGRRSTGSTNPYVPPRSPRRARFSDDVVDANNRSRHGSGYQDEFDQQASPHLISPISDEPPNNNGSPRHMPGGWRGSRDWDQSSGNHRGSFSSDRPSAGRMADMANPRSTSLSDLRQQEENVWYRGRQTGDVKAIDTDPGKMGYESRFYANRGAGHAV
jgi:hypothetical protein